MKLNDEERLALLITLDKVIGAELDRSNPDGIRAREDAELMDGFMRAGVDRKRYLVRGKSVGTLSITYTPASEDNVAYVTDEDAFVDWFTHDGNGAQIMRDYLRVSSNVVKLMRYVRDYILTTGEIPAGIDTRPERTPEKVGTTARGFKPEVVAQAFGVELSEAVGALLALPEGE